MLFKLSTSVGLQEGFTIQQLSVVGYGGYVPWKWLLSCNSVLIGERFFWRWPSLFSNLQKPCLNNSGHIISYNPSTNTSWSWKTYVKMELTDEDKNWRWASEFEDEVGRCRKMEELKLTEFHPQDVSEREIAWLR